MLVNALLVVLSSQSVWARKSEPPLDQGPTGLFRGSDQYDFAIVVPAAGTDCFWHFAHQSGSFYLTYIVQWTTGVSSDHRLFVTVSSPLGALLASENQAVGHMNLQTEVTGFYRMCLGNHNNKFGSARVFLHFGVIYEGFEESRRETEEGEKAFNSTLTRVEKRLQKLQNHIFHMRRHYNFARMSRGKDHHLLLSNLSYVDWWSASQSLAIVLSGCVQLLVLKRLFHAQGSRPRC